MKIILSTLFAIFTLCAITQAQQPAPASQPAPVNPAPVTAKKITPLPLTAPKSEKDLLIEENTIRAEKLKRDLADLRGNVQKLKLEKELLTEKLAVSELKRKQASEKDDVKYEQEFERLNRASQLAKAKAAKSASDLKTLQNEWNSKTAQLEAEIKTLEAEKKRDAYANAKPIYLENPLQADGTLVVSDRRIALNGVITYRTADYITSRINYYNNKDPKKPIFLVIDSSPGGSVMAGYRIIKAMEGSQAPVYVVVKSFAASMAAAICTLAEQSYAYPNAIILHHQMSTTLFFARLNLTQQKELYKESQRWWKRLATPIAKKMGITPDEFIKKMYAKNTSADWSEFGTEAQKLKWVDHIVQRIRETSLLKNPDTKNTIRSYYALKESTDKDGHPCVYLPRLNPKDCYFLYNKDGYYKMK